MGTRRYTLPVVAPTGDTTARQPVRDFMFDQIEATNNWSSVYMVLNYRGIDTSERRVRLSPAGEHYLLHVGAALSAIATATDDLRQGIRNSGGDGPPQGLLLVAEPLLEQIGVSASFGVAQWHRGQPLCLPGRLADAAGAHHRSRPVRRAWRGHVPVRAHPEIPG